MTKQQLNKLYRDLLKEYEKNLADGIKDEGLLEEVEELEKELNYMAESDRFYF